MIKVVCFDLGGVLVRITTDMADAARRAGVAVGGSPGSFLDFPPFIDFQAGRLSEAAYLGELSAWLGVDSAQALAAHNHILVEPYPGTLELIDALEADGVLCGCLSNTNAPHWREMKEGSRFPNVSRLSVAVASHEHRMEKPNNDIFERFRELAGRPQPEEIVFFDDTPANVDTARALGWRAWPIDPAGDTAMQMHNAIDMLSDSA